MFQPLDYNFAIFLSSINAVCRVWQVTAAEVMSNTRRRPVAEARQMAYLLCYERIESGTEVAKLFRKNHASIYHGVGKMKFLAEYDTEIKEKARETLRWFSLGDRN